VDALGNERSVTEGRAANSSAKKVENESGPVSRVAVADGRPNHDGHSQFTPIGRILDIFNNYLYLIDRSKP
jgi:hypothetical protein